jgi:hypothetical protein
MDRIEQIATIIETKYNINATWLMKLPEEDRTNELKIGTRIKELLGDRLSIKKRNSLSRFLTFTLMNDIYERKPSITYVSLKEYVNGKTNYIVRVSDIENLLEEKHYLQDDFPTALACGKKLVFTKFTDHEINDFKKHNGILTLWNSSFLDRLIKKNGARLSLTPRTYDIIKPKTKKVKPSPYDFIKPKTKKEGMNCINNILSILAQENPNLPIDPYLSYSDNLYNLLSCKLQTTERATNQVNYLFRHVLFMETHYRKKSLR